MSGWSTKKTFFSKDRATDITKKVGHISEGLYWQHRLEPVLLLSVVKTSCLITNLYRFFCKKTDFFMVLRVTYITESICNTTEGGARRNHSIMDHIYDTAKGRHDELAKITVLHCVAVLLGRSIRDNRLKRVKFVTVSPVHVPFGNQTMSLYFQSIWVKLYFVGEVSHTGLRIS